MSVFQRLDHHERPRSAAGRSRSSDRRFYCPLRRAERRVLGERTEIIYCIVGREKKIAVGGTDIHSFVYPNAACRTLLQENRPYDGAIFDVGGTDFYFLSILTILCNLL